MLKDPLLHLFQPIMIRIQDGTRLFQIDCFTGGALPWKRKQEVQIIADDVFLGIAHAHRIQLLRFL